ncbi:MAG: tetratricopeptide repeat protein [Spirochaetaceae bacterium]|nr:MAG: tetratricopeptide repeat protein [Spirochaetaceae bacterium]
MVVAVALAAVILISCAGESGYYIVGTSEQQQELRELFRILDRNGDDDSARVILLEHIAGHLLEAGYPERMRVFLTSHVETYPEDPYNAYYLLLVARNYNSDRMAQHYYQRILANYSDLSIRGNSVHYSALSELLRLTEQPAVRIRYYHDLLERFRDRIDVGSTYYYMARTYEELGEWDEAFAAYRRFLSYPETRILGFPEAHRHVRDRVNFYDSSRDWTMESLDTLVNTLKSAIWRQDVRTLLRHKADENFFAMSWEQEEYDSNSQIAFNLGSFLLRSRVRYAADLELNSNAREAYLRTWGWSHRIRTWYLYFRRVDFPADPEIHGNWEWAGIYFGEAM